MMLSFAVVCWFFLCESVDFLVHSGLFLSAISLVTFMSSWEVVDSVRVLTLDFNFGMYCFPYNLLTVNFEKDKLFFVHAQHFLFPVR